MCLLYLLLFGCNGCGCNESCGCDQCCGNARGRGACCGDSESGNGGCGRASVCSQNSCCSCRRDCSGFGRHGGDSVCCDAEYYNRQYALCCKCKVVRRCCNN